MKGFGIFDEEEDALDGNLPLAQQSPLPAEESDSDAVAKLAMPEPAVAIPASSLLLFRKGRQRYAVDVQYVKEVHGGLKVQRLPLASPHFSGVVIVNGAVVVVLADEIIFSQFDRQGSAQNISNDETFIIFEIGSDHLAVKANEASQVINVDEVSIRSLDAGRQSTAPTFSGITQFSGESVLILDILSLIHTIKG
ncbi:MAG: chemotaxis protein CheW [Proteobacteria bacterium]|nr:MAG: chemotaxis protein CheW [Pseudomonadota bacterium]